VRLPAPTTQPCNDCPWRRVAAPGWLGPMDADQWVALAHSDMPVACHLTIPEGGSGGRWLPVMRQCAGAAIYRRNVAKLVREPSDASNMARADRTTVFANPMEFKDYHTRRGGDA
jgi:hypothetical protein